MRGVGGEREVDVHSGIGWSRKEKSGARDFRTMDTQMPAAVIFERMCIVLVCVAVYSRMRVG